MARLELAGSDQQCETSKIGVNMRYRPEGYVGESLLPHRYDGPRRDP